MTGNTSRWLLPEDNIIDQIAIDIAARGIRPVALTPTERRLAAEQILTNGGTAHQIATRLNISNHRARALITHITDGVVAA